MRLIILAMIAIIASTTAFAQEFYLQLDQTGKKYGPYRFINGDKIELGKGIFTIITEEPKPEPVPDQVTPTTIYIEGIPDYVTISEAPLPIEESGQIVPEHVPELDPVPAWEEPAPVESEYVPELDPVTVWEAPELIVEEPPTEQKPEIEEEEPELPEGEDLTYDTSKWLKRTKIKRLVLRRTHLDDAVKFLAYKVRQKRKGKGYPIEFEVIEPNPDALVTISVAKDRVADIIKMLAAQAECDYSIEHNRVIFRPHAGE